MSTSSKLKNDFLNEMENISKKERFGLFTQPLPLSMNEDSLNRRPQTAQPYKNINTCASKSGKINNALFSNPGYISINDKYKDGFKRDQLNQKEKYDKIPFNSPFKLTHNKKNTIQPPYEYIPNPYPPNQSKIDENGKVKTAPRSIYTSSFNKNKICELFGSYQYHIDPYENQKASDLKEVVEHRRRMLSAKPFCSNNHSNQTFTSDFQTYGEKFAGKTHKKMKKCKSNLVRHEYPFRPNNPSKKGFNKTFDRFPLYMEEQLFDYRSGKMKAMEKLRELDRQKAWMPNYNGTLSKPSPPILNRIVSARSRYF